MNLHQQFIEKFKASGLNISRLARLADLDRDTVNNYILHNSNIRIHNYEKLLKVIESNNNQ